FLPAPATTTAPPPPPPLTPLPPETIALTRGEIAQVTTVNPPLSAPTPRPPLPAPPPLAHPLIPAMKSKGYSKEFSAAVLSSSATLAVIIPPSIPMILYAAMADTSVVKLFVGGVIPGVLGGLLMMTIAYWFARKYNFPVEERFQWARVWVTLKEAGWALVLPAIILGGIFGGVVTATEGAALAVLAAIFIGVVVYRELHWRELYAAMIDGAVQTAVVMLLVAASALLGVHLTEIQAPQKLA